MLGSSDFKWDRSVITGSSVISSFVAVLLYSVSFKQDDSILFDMSRSNELESGIVTVSCFNLFIFSLSFEETSYCDCSVLNELDCFPIYSI